MNDPSPTFKDTDYLKLQKLLATTPNNTKLYQVIVDEPFKYKVESALLLLGIVVLLLANKKTSSIDRVALSNTSLAKDTTKVSVKRFEDIKIPLDHPDNAIAKAILSGKHQDVTDWDYLFMPALTAKQARLNQAGGGIGYSCVYPLVGLKDGGALIFSYYLFAGKLQFAQRDFMRKYSSLVTNSLKQLGL